MKNLKALIILQEIFYSLTGALVIFILLEILRPRLVLNYFNLNYLVVLWIVAAGLVIYKNRQV
jgi:hypothetical protein